MSQKIAAYVWVGCVLVWAGLTYPQQVHAEQGGAATATALPALGCTLEPSRRVAVSSPVAGVIETFELDRGAAVRQGDLLFRLHHGVELAAVALAEVKSAFATRKLARNSDLLADELLSAHERDELETEQMLAEAELRTAREQLSLRSIRSPVDGIVVDKLIMAGEYVSVDPVLELAQLDPLHVELLMPATWFGRLAPEQTLAVQVGEPIDARLAANVSVIDPVIDRGSATFRVRLRLANPQNRIPSGLSCTVYTLD